MAAEKIIIVEDDKILQKALAVQLLSAGFEVLASSDGAKTLELIDREKPALVLLDLVLPGRSGFDILTDLKNDRDLQKIPVVILSNLGNDQDRDRGLALGAADYFIKSDTDLEALTAKIKGLLT